MVNKSINNSRLLILTILLANITPMGVIIWDITGISLGINHFFIKMTNLTPINKRNMTLKVLSLHTSPKTTNQILIKTIKLTETLKLIETIKLKIETLKITITIITWMLILISTLQCLISTTLRLIKDTIMNNNTITHP